MLNPLNLNEISVKDKDHVTPKSAGGKTISLYND